MKEYVSLQAVLDIVMQYCPDDDGSCSKVDVDLREMLDEIEALVAADVKEKEYCKMIPLEPDCRGYTDVFICTNCHQHVHLGFIRKEYSGSFCLECGAEIMEQRSDNVKSIQKSNLLETEVEGLFLNCEQDGDTE